MAEDKPTRWQSTTITRRAFLRSSTVAVGTLAAVTACGGGGGSSAPVGGAPGPSPAPGPAPAPGPTPPPARYHCRLRHQDQHQRHHRHLAPPSLIQRRLTLRKIQFRKVGDGSTTAVRSGPRCERRTDWRLAPMVPKIPTTIRTLTCLDLGPTSRLRPLSTSTLALLGDPHEVELLLRWADSAGNARGYECLFHFNGQVQLMRWNGPFGGLHRNSQRHWPKSAGRALVTGDVIKATINGNTIRAFLNGVELSQVTDSTWPTGQPGIGFFKRTTGVNGGFAITSYTAASF